MLPFIHLANILGILAYGSTPAISMENPIETNHRSNTDLRGHPVMRVHFPQASDVELYSDQTARGGGTLSSLIDLPGYSGLEWAGVLRGILNDQGERVGFVGVRIPLRIPTNTRYLEIRLDGENQLIIRANFQTATTWIPGIPGSLSYQVTLIRDQTRASVATVDLHQVQPSIRGRQIGFDLAPPFRVQDVQTFSIEMKLSEQMDPRKGVGIPFNIRILK